MQFEIMQFEKYIYLNSQYLPEKMTVIWMMLMLQYNINYDQ